MRTVLPFSCPLHKRQTENSPYALIGNTGKIRYTPCMKTLRHTFPDVLVLALGLTGCGPQTPRPRLVYEAATVRDLAEFPQNLTGFAMRAGRDTPLIPQQRSSVLYEQYKKRFFAAWNQNKPGRGNVEYMRAALNRSGVKRGFAENLQPWNSTRWSAMRENADLGAMPSLRISAVTVRGTSLRLLPTERPQLANPAAPGQSFPFDEAQQTSLHVGTPLVLLHASRDGAWFYAESGVACGWIPAADVVGTDEEFRRLWRDAPLAACHDDDVPLKDENGRFLAHADIGTVLPFERVDGTMRVLVPMRDTDGNVRIARARTSASSFRAMPQPLTPGRVAELGDRMMGQSYGWGGMYGDRDCSSTLRDLFAPFGVWLPRNSSAQAGAGLKIDLRKLSPEDKERRILADGIPFLTLLQLPGHIGLYVGPHNGRPAFFHNIWGLRTEPSPATGGWPGRHVLGRAVVTSLRPGAELPDINKDALLIHRMSFMTVLGK